MSVRTSLYMCLLPTHAHRTALLFLVFQLLVSVATWTSYQSWLNTDWDLAVSFWDSFSKRSLMPIKIPQCTLVKKCHAGWSLVGRRLLCQCQFCQFGQFWKYLTSIMRAQTLVWLQTMRLWRSVDIWFCSPFEASPYTFLSSPRRCGGCATVFVLCWSALKWWNGDDEIHIHTINLWRWGIQSFVFVQNLHSSCLPCSA